MSLKRKFIFILIAVAVVAIVGISSVAYVMAATSQTVESNIKIVYTASQVSGSVSATYKIGASGTATAMKTNGSTGDTTITFTGSTASQTGSLRPATDITLSDTNTYVEFVYSFTNSSTTTAYSVTMSYTGTATNIDFSVKKGSETSFSAVTGTNIVSSGASVAANTSSTPYTITVRATIHDVASNASWDGSFTVNMNGAA